MDRTTLKEIQEDFIDAVNEVADTPLRELLGFSRRSPEHEAAKPAVKKRKRKARTTPNKNVWSREAQRAEKAIEDFGGSLLLEDTLQRAIPIDPVMLARHAEAEAVVRAAKLLDPNIDVHGNENLPEHGRYGGRCK